MSGYSAYALAYWDSGFRGVLPLPPGKKYPPPQGYTGVDGRFPSYPDVCAWTEQEHGNLGLRLPHGLIGIDVDANDGKTGGRTLARAQQVWGELPPTVMSTARDDGVSGIRLYRVPEAMRFRSQLVFPAEGLGHVDIIQHDHRYLVAAPSIHPDTGTPYRWLSTDGAVLDTIPRAADVPRLPARWVHELRAEPAVRATTNGDDAADVLAGMGPEPMDDTVFRYLTGAREVLRSPAGGRHDETLKRVMGLLRLHEAGHKGAREALAHLGTAYVEAVSDRSDRAEASEEYRRMITNGRGHALIAATPSASLADLMGPAQRTGNGSAPPDPAPSTNGSGPPSTEATAAEPIPAQYHRGQVRFAYRLVARHEGELLHVAGLGWHAWDGKRWTRDETGAATRAVLAELREALAESLGDKELRDDVRRCETAAGVAGVLDIASNLTPFVASVRDLDADPYLLNCSNGTLDLRTRTLRPHDPADRITKACNAAYRPGTDSGTWARFLDRVLPDAEVREFVGRLAGAALIGRVVEHVLPIFIGTGANGKSVWCKAISHALGDYAGTAEPDLFMHREGAHPTGEMDLLGIRLAVVSEMEQGRRLAESTMKRLTGGDVIRARRMHRDFVEFEPSHTAVLVTNFLPKVTGDDPAIWRRVRVVPFQVTIPPEEQDKCLDERLRLEADAVLAWAVAGYVDYARRGGLDDPASVRVATDAYHSDSDAVGRFVAERCVTVHTVKSTTAALFEAWERWRRDDGAEEITRKAFGQALDRLGYPTNPPSNGKRWRPGITALPPGIEEGE